MDEIDEYSTCFQVPERRLWDSFSGTLLDEQLRPAFRAAVTSPRDSPTWAKAFNNRYDHPTLAMLSVCIHFFDIDLMVEAILRWEAYVVFARWRLQVPEFITLKLNNIPRENEVPTRNVLHECKRATSSYNWLPIIEEVERLLKAGGIEPTQPDDPLPVLEMAHFLHSDARRNGLTSKGGDILELKVPHGLNILPFVVVMHKVMGKSMLVKSPGFQDLHFGPLQEDFVIRFGKIGSPCISTSKRALRVKSQNPGLEEET